MVRFEVDPTKKFASALDKVSKEVGDLTVPMTLIAQSWFKTNRAIYSLKGPGKYVDLSPEYKVQKRKEFGFVYPVLKATGRLEKSITQPDSPESVNRILNKNTLFLGTTTPYAGFLQEGTSRMPARPPVLLGSEQVSPPEVNRRIDAWIQILAQYAVDKSAQLGGTQ